MKKILVSVMSIGCALSIFADAFDYDAKLKLAEKGDAVAQNEIGEYYADGGGGKFSPRYMTAFAWWEKAAGNGVKRNGPKAVAYWLEAAKRGDPEAQYLMGQAYSGGISVLPDVNTAVFWWDKAAKQNHPKAQFCLAFAYAKGQGVRERDPQKAFELWKAAAEQGHLQAQVYLALCYFTGEGVKPDLAKAFSIWTAAADFGNRDAMRYLGILYANGTGVKKDTKRAMELFAAAAKKGDKEAASYYEQLRLDSSVPAPKSIK